MNFLSPKTEKPICPKCKTARFVEEDVIFVHLDFHVVWKCTECGRILETIKSYS